MNFRWFKFLFEIFFFELHMSFNGFMSMRMRKPHFESKFQSDEQN